MIPASIGCILELVLGGRNTSFTLIGSETLRWAGQLSRTSAMVRFSCCMVWSRFLNHSSKSMLVIHDLVLFQYVIGSFVLAPYKNP